MKIRERRKRKRERERETMNTYFRRLRRRRDWLSQRHIIIFTVPPLQKFEEKNTHW
jgi:hypothetical protein